eukprot:728164-Pelagomonas_calceolata.AAC.6
MSVHTAQWRRDPRHACSVFLGKSFIVANYAGAGQHTIRHSPGDRIRTPSRASPICDTAAFPITLICAGEH